MIGHERPGPEMPAEHQAVDVGQPEVEHDQIGLGRVDDVERHRSGAGDVHLVPARLERRGQHFLLGTMILDHQDDGVGRHAQGTVNRIVAPIVTGRVETATGAWGV